MPTAFELERGVRMPMVLPREGRVMQVMERRWWLVMETECEVVDVERENVMQLKVAMEKIGQRRRGRERIMMANILEIPKSRREEIVETIQEILEDHGYYEEG